MDRVLINGVAFRFQAYPTFILHDLELQNISQDVKYFRALGPSLNKIEVVFPKGAHVPPELGDAMREGKIGFDRITNNPLLPVDRGIGMYAPPVQYTFVPTCLTAADCKAIVVDLDHDGFNDVIIISDLHKQNNHIPFNATLLKTDGKTWTVKANVALCKEIVPDLAKARIEIKPSSWGTLKLGENRYPVVPNLRCNNGTQLL